MKTALPLHADAAVALAPAPSTGSRRPTRDPVVPWGLPMPYWLAKDRAENCEPADVGVARLAVQRSEAARPAVRGAALAAARRALAGLGRRGTAGRLLVRRRGAAHGRGEVEDRKRRAAAGADIRPDRLHIGRWRNGRGRGGESASRWRSGRRGWRGRSSGAGLDMMGMGLEAGT